MKYLITESRLDQVINNFITKIVGEKLDRVESKVAPITWFHDPKNGKLVFEIDDNAGGDTALGVSNEIYFTVRRMFSLWNNETDKAFMDWMTNYTGKKFPSGVYNFDPNNGM
jgi:hypothetical protein